ncbi:MAG: LysE family translocator [Emticicia sp.]|uniref:LysE family translocator n=1 Tax=Emticicia sp. TaxID=1930953 RepID=UPI003BA7C5A4
MSESFAILLLTALISFVGSIQPGPVNLSVVQATLSQSFKVGVWVAASGTLPEIIYTLIALKGQTFLNKNPLIFEVLEIAVIPFFLIIGIHSFYFQSKTIKDFNLAKRRSYILVGFVNGMLNPQLLPFWVVVLVYLNTYFNLNSFSSKLSFVLGAALGAFLVLLNFAFLAKHFQHALLVFFHRYSIEKVIGLFFILMSVFQTFKILF